MGINIFLSVYPEKIDSDDWQIVYAETLQLLKACGIAGLKRDKIVLNGDALERTIYTRNLEREIESQSDRHWHANGIMGDYEFGESFRLYKNIRRYGEFHTELYVDILVDKINDYQDHDGIKHRNFFDGKTQGQSYHIPILACAMLVEAWFPMWAMVSGDIDIYQAEEAGQLIKEHLGKEISLPVCVDKVNLLDRLSKHYQGPELLDCFHQLIQEDRGRDRGEILQFLFDRCERGEVEQWFSENLKAYQSAGQFGAIDLMTDWFNADQELSRLIQIACLQENGACFNSLDFARGLAATWISIPKELVRQLELLQLPKGQPHGVWSLFGNVFLDMFGGKGRNIRSYISESEVLSVFETFFPDDKEIQAEYTKQTKKLIESLDLTSLGIDFKALMEEYANTDDQFRADGEAFFMLNSEADLTTGQEMFLTAIARNVHRYNDGDSKKKEILTDTINGLKKMIIKISDKYGPVCTEKAWEWIDGETDRELLVCLLILTILKGDQRDYVAVKQAIFEKRWLACKVLSLSKDENAIAELENFFP
ncbi:hypothetical protein [Desulfotignum balticum]|jgi:hypothetical protein|uniref:hypothetical protein n=1 Tax=Desulfotignum balticum TaxID=115781 RepID=UPI0003F8E009|nr:hypothetical protein [Desulfotignum balticum]